MVNDNKNFIIKLVILSLFVIVLWFLYKILNILVILSISLFLTILISPILNKLNKFKINDFFWILIVYFFLFIFLLVFIFSIVPIFVKQITLLNELVTNNINNYLLLYNTKWISWLWLPNFLTSYISTLDIWQLLISIKSNLWTISTFVTKNLSTFITSWVWLVSTFTNTLFNIILILTFTLFIWLERKEIRTLFYKILTIKQKSYLLKREEKIVDTLFSWIKSQFLLSISIFFITLIWLFSLRLFWVKIDEVLTLSLIAWMMEFVPYIWPFIALIPAIAIWLGLWLKATILIFILYIIIQQVENNVLVPYIMWKSLSLSPFSVLIWMTIWWSLFWILWIIIAVPFVAVLQIFVIDYLKNK